ncbi:uncharacterized protein LOC108910967 isoform X2 [Anoplophora glabripennis]|uniref:uncharacterized protein LOC108910967 isoform X2 n=1 Tax=Anoplophora glabripennis TaxID=217634 RepID=UPI0008748AE1|nr:uncharacterized protein LOC108910967 isoform X2 [Anoplophora glabripennis]
MNNFGGDYLGENSDFEDEEYDSEKEDYEETYYRQQIESDNDSNARNSDSDNDYRREKSELELLREKNIKERDAFLAKLMNDPEYADVVASANELKKSNINKITKPRRDPSFQYKGQFSIPVEKRRSSRLQNVPPVFFKEDLIDEIEMNRKRKRSQEYDYYDLETVIYHPKKSRASSHNTVRTPIVPVEDITDNMIANIARKGTTKVYSDTGTSCHQCRQKTKDQKTFCRSLSCVGVRGQFCGVCLENRYGEDVAVVLKDPMWKCPVCRDICNCSFCRHKAGKRPTGILAPLAQQSGHKSVKDFLESLKGEGDYVHQDAVWKKLNDSSCLLGYSTDLKFAHMGRNVTHKINSFLSWEGLKNFICKKENELESVIDHHNEPRCLLGFFQGTDNALLDDGSHCHMGPTYLKYEQLIQTMQAKLTVVEKEYITITKTLEITGRKRIDDVSKKEINYNETLEGKKEFVLTQENKLVVKQFHHEAKVAEIIEKKFLCTEDVTKNEIDFSASVGEKELIQKEGHELELMEYVQDKPKYKKGIEKKHLDNKNNINYNGKESKEFFLKEENALIVRKDEIDISDKRYLDKFAEITESRHLCMEDDVNKNETDSSVGLGESKELIKKKLELMVSLQDNPKHLLGFLKGTGQALMDDGTSRHIGPIYFKHNNDK